MQRLQTPLRRQGMVAATIVQPPALTAKAILTYANTPRSSMFTQPLGSMIAVEQLTALNGFEPLIHILQAQYTQREVACCHIEAGQPLSDSE